MPLQVNKISKRYNGKWALKDVSLEAAGGEIVGIYGLSGAGKTTLINAVAGNTETNGGSVIFDGNDVTGLSPRERGFAQAAPTEGDSVWSNLFGGKRDAHYPDGAAQMMALDSVLKDAGGVLLLDHSFCQMDDRMRSEAFRKVREAVSDKKLAALYATNSFDEILQLCDRVVILDGGSAIQEGRPHDVYDNPVSAASAGVTGRNNLFSARRLTSSKADLPEFQTIDGNHRLFTEKAEINRLGAINQNVTLSIRPEHITLSFGASFPEDNLLKAKITTVKLLGATTRIGLNADGLQLEALVLRLVGLNPGDECMLGLPPDRIHILKD